MTTPARSQRKDTVRAAKRTLILDAALAVFARDGLDGASMRAIAEAAGYTAAAIYFHFPSKEAIYGELLRHSLDRLVAAVEKAAAAPASPSTQLGAAGLAFFDFYAEHPRDLDLGFYLFRGGMRPRGLSPDLDADLNERLLACLQPVADAARQLGASPRQAQAVVADVFAHAIGLLLAQHTGRMRLFRQDARRLMLAHLDRLTRELTEP